MREYAAETLLWLFVINLGIGFGAGLYEKRVTVPQWFPASSEAGRRVNSEAMRQADAGRRFWAYVTTGPLTVLTLGNLAIAWWSRGPRRAWWLAAAVIILVERIATFAYFIPTAVTLMNAQTLAEPTAQAMASQWVRLNYGRSALTLVGWLAALRTLSLPR